MVCFPINFRVNDSDHVMMRAKRLPDVTVVGVAGQISDVHLSHMIKRATAERLLTSNAPVRTLYNKVVLTRPDQLPASCSILHPTGGFLETRSDDHLAFLLFLSSSLACKPLRAMRAQRFNLGENSPLLIRGSDQLSCTVFRWLMRLVALHLGFEPERLIITHADMGPSTRSWLPGTTKLRP